jgi:hypothetical protein
MMDLRDAEFVRGIAGTLGWFYALASCINLMAAGMACGRKRWRSAIAWGAVAVGFAGMAVGAFGGRPPVMPDGVKDTLDRLLGPVTFTLGSLLVLAAMYWQRSFWTRPEVAWLTFNLSLVFLGLSLTDADFAAVVLKPDHVPIVGMVYLLGFFTWLGTAQAVENDRRMGMGQGVREKDLEEKVLVWPDLVYIELIAMVLVTAALLVWSMLVRAPLEQPANPAITPNPSKAPWYFLGLQEMLVYFDPATAGVILPSLIILGLMAIPYLDANPHGSGYYTIAQRRFAYLVFQFGFLQLWILMILVGTFFRGPNWSFFGLYEPHDLHRLPTLPSLKLSEFVWTIWFHRPIPQSIPGSGLFVELGTIALREVAGIVILALYFLGLPLLLARTWLKPICQSMERTRYTILSLLLLMMLALPLKMLLRWTFGLSYLLSVPEYFLYF